MKKISKLLCIVMAVTMLLTFTACNSNNGSSSGTGEVVMRLGDFTLTESEYMYLATYVKSMVVYNQQNMMYQYTGTVYEEADILSMKIDEDSTVADYIKDYTNELAQKLLIMEKLCADANINITNQEDIDAINNYIADIEYAYGGTDLFEIALARLGFSRSGIERFQKFSVLFELLYDHRYGENGIAQISQETVYKYFTDNYIKYDGALYSYSEAEDAETPVFEFTDEGISQYFFDNYVKVRHVLYLTQNLDEEAKSEKEQKAKASFDAIIKGEKTLDDIKSETEDNGYEYTFTYGEMVEEFENASFDMEVGEVRLVESEYGFHIVEKLEITDEDLYGTTDEDGKTTGGKEDYVTSAMIKAELRKEALETLDKLNSGELDAYPEKNSDVVYYFQMGSQFIDKTDSNNAYLVSIIGDKEKDVYIEHEISGEGTYILRNVSFDSEDITADIYSTIEENLGVEAFSDYTETFFDSVETNNEILEKFDVITLPMLEDEFYTE